MVFAARRKLCRIFEKEKLICHLIALVSLLESGASKKGLFNPEIISFTPMKWMILP